MFVAMRSWFTDHLPYPQNNDFQAVPWRYTNRLDNVADYLTSGEYDLDQWMSWKKEIKELIEKNSDDLNQLNIFFTKITEWGIEQDPEKMLAFLVEVVDLKLFTDLISFKTAHSAAPFHNFIECVIERSSLYLDSEVPAPSWKASLYSEWKHFRPLYLISNLVDVFLRAAYFLDPQKNFVTSLWEAYLAIEIASKFFMIPYCLIKNLQPTLALTVKTYVVAVLAVTILGTLVSIYQRWLKPLPSEIVNCTNLDNQMEMGWIEPKVGQAKELEQLIAALNVPDTNVLLIGNSGEGKTALLHHFVQLKQAGKLSSELEKLRVFEVNCGLMISHRNYGHSELINQIKQQISCQEENILLVLDEYYQIVQNKEAFLACKKLFFEDRPRPKFIATMTFKEYKEMQKLDADRSFRRRVVPIILNSSSEELNRLILQEQIHRLAPDIPIAESAIEKILTYSADETYLSGIGRPAKAIKLLKDAIGFCKQVYADHYQSKELIDARQKLQRLRWQAIHEITGKPETWGEMRACREKIKALEKELSIHKRQIKKIKCLLESQRCLKEDYVHLTQLFAKSIARNLQEQETIEEEFFENEKQNIAKKNQAKTIESWKDSDQIKYLWYAFYAFEATKKNLKCQIEKISELIPVQVNGNLIDRIYRESEEIERDLQDNNRDTTLLVEQEIEEENDEEERDIISEPGDT